MYIHLKFVQFWQNKYGFLRNKKHLLRLSKIQGDASRVQKLTVTEMAENQVTLTWVNIFYILVFFFLFEIN